MAEQPMTLRYENMLEDMVALQLHCLETVPAMRQDMRTRRLWYSVAVFMVLFVACEWVLYRFRVEPISWRFLIAFGISGAGALWRALDYPRLVRKYVEKQVAAVGTREQHPGYFSEHVLRADGEGLHLCTAVTESRTAWAAIQRMEYTPEHVFLFTGSTDAFIVPRNRLTEGDLPAFLEEVGRHLGQPSVVRA